MGRGEERLDLSKLRTVPLASRPCKVSRSDYGQPPRAGQTFAGFWGGLPKQLKARELKELVALWAAAVREGMPVVAMCGAHVLKVGLGPLVIQAMRKRWLTALALNGAGAVHDFELAYQGATSEDVARGLEDGSFGMAAETATHLNAAAKVAQKEGIGFGQALAAEIEKAKARYPDESVILQGVRQGVPVTIHVAIGTDIVHQHPSADGAAIGAATYRDFEIFCGVVAGLRGGGLVLNIGSAVILPEVFLKALTVARNLREGVEGFSTANFDMLPQYRPRVNVVQRPTQGRGRGFEFLGPHEILIPLVFGALVEALEG